MRESQDDRRGPPEIVARRIGAPRLEAGASEVLVLEDEPAQREALARAFWVAGLTVRGVSNGLEAFEALQARDYRAIVCDIRMPEQSGPTFFDQLEEAYPHLTRRVVFVSAYADDPEVSTFLVRTGQPFLKKPYDVSELVALVRQVMHRPFRRGA
jgi:CheY-like chemotaxis protein